MKKELKDKWVAKMSDPFTKQAYASLVEQDGEDGYAFCAIGCLGVVAGCEPKPKTASRRRATLECHGDQLSTYDIGRVTGLNLDTIDQLISFNDIQEWGLPRIAGWVEAHVEVDNE